MKFALSTVKRVPQPYGHAELRFSRSFASRTLRKSSGLSVRSSSASPPAHRWKLRTPPCADRQTLFGSAKGMMTPSPALSTVNCCAADDASQGATTSVAPGVGARAARAAARRDASARSCGEKRAGAAERAETGERTEAGEREEAGEAEAGERTVAIGAG